MDFITRYKLFVNESSILAAGLSRSQKLAALTFDHYDRRELVMPCLSVVSVDSGGTNGIQVRVG